MADELKLCHWCGSPMVATYENAIGWHRVECDSCGRAVMGKDASFESAIAAWNELSDYNPGTVYDGTDATLPPLLTDTLVEMPGGTRFCCKHDAEGDVLFVNDESFKLPKGCRWWLWPGGGE